MSLGLTWHEARVRFERSGLLCCTSSVRHDNGVLRSESNWCVSREGLCDKVMASLRSERKKVGSDCSDTDCPSTVYLYIDIVKAGWGCTLNSRSGGEIKRIQS